MKSQTKNLKVLALILLTSVLLVASISSASVKAQTQPSVYVYNSQGGNIDANGTQLTPSTNYNYTSGDTINYTPVAGDGFAFLCWDWIGTAPVTSTSTTLTESITATSACAIQALFIPVSNATQTVGNRISQRHCPTFSRRNNISISRNSISFIHKLHHRLTCQLNSNSKFRLQLPILVSR